MAKSGEKLWYLQLDFDWMHDAKIVRLKAKYGRGLLLDAVNTFVLMAKCGGLADMSDPAHADWAAYYIGKSGKALRSTFDKLAEFEVINAELWESLGHVTSARACADAKKRRKEDEANKSRTAKAREALERKRKEGGGAGPSVSVTDAVTETVADQ